MKRKGPSVRRVVKRRASANPSLQYPAEPIVIHETAFQRTVLRPWYVDHKTGPPTLAARLEQSKRARKTDEWSEPVVISLQAVDIPRLADALSEELVVAGLEDSAESLVVSGGDASVGDQPGSTEMAEAVIALLNEPEVLSGLRGTDLGDRLLRGLRDAVRLEALRRAMGELSSLLKSGTDDERTYQLWCQEHSWGFGNAYTKADSLRRISRTSDVDVLLPRVLSGYRDVVELKRPGHPVLVEDKSHGTRYFSAQASSAVAQCQLYMDELHEDAARGLRGRPEVVAYHPRGTVVIGRSEDWVAEMYQHLARANETLNRITVMTYDQLLAQGLEMIRALEEPQDPDESSAAVDPGPGDWGPLDEFYKPIDPD